MARLTNFKDEVGTQLLNPLKGMYTTRAIRNALENANGITGGLAGVVRGRKDASSAEQMTMWLYRNMLLITKATAQLAKTVLSVPTHIRNFLSAGAFAGANGILFEGMANIIEATIRENEQRLGNTLFPLGYKKKIDDFCL